MLVSLGRDLKDVGTDLLLLTSSGKVLLKNLILKSSSCYYPKHLALLDHASLIPVPAEEAGEVYHH